jgi:uncharacterized phage protein gp47/JayE
MAFEIPTLDESTLFAVAHYAALFPEDDVSRASFNFLWCLTFAACVTSNHAHIEAVKNDVIPDQSEGDTLRRWAAIRGVTPKGATGARKANALRVVGTPATAIPALSELVHDDTGLAFRVTAAAVIDAVGYVDVDVAAISTGAQTQLAAGQLLRFTTPIANVEEVNELQLDLDEDGTDAELDASLRLRVLSRFSAPPRGGAQADYVQWAIEVTGWEVAYTYPLRAGLGTVDVAALHAGSGDARVPTPTEVEELQALIDLKRPVSVKQTRVLLVEAETENVEVTVIANGEPEFAFDWDDSTPPEVAAWTAGTRVLQFTADRPASMKAGDRLTFSTGETGAERVIEVLGPGTDEVTLEADDAGDTPEAADLVYSGGPLVEPARAAIQALIDSLGTANPDSDRYGSWEGSLRPTAISRAATSVEGVLDGTVVAPAATVEASDPDFPDDDTIGLIIAGRILVRAEH